jgi:hypothetical protein
MILKKTLSVLFICLWVITAEAQYNPFFQMYNGSNEVAILSMDTTHDGGYILNAVDQSTNGGDFLVIKTDVNGYEEWRYRNNQFDGLDSSNVMFTITETLDKGFIIGGKIARDFSSGNYSDALIVKLDSVGNLAWEKSFDFSPVEEANSIYLEGDSTYIVSLRIIGKEKILHLNNNGDTLWTSEINLPGTAKFDVKKIYQLDTSYYLLGMCDSILINFGYPRIIKTDIVGHLIWQKSYLDTSGSIGNSYWLASDSTFLINSYMRSPSSFYYPRQIKIGLQGDLLDTLYPNIYGIYDSDSTIMFVYSGSVNYDSLYIGRANYYTGQKQNFASLYLPSTGIHDIVLDRNKNILTCGSQDIFGKTGILIRAVDTLLNLVVPEFSNSDAPSVSIFPNPTSEWLHVNVKGLKNYSFTLFNTIGDEIFTFKNHNNPFLSFKVNDFPKGLYFYRIDSSKQKVSSGKIIIN